MRPGVTTAAPALIDVSKVLRQREGLRPTPGVRIRLFMQPGATERPQEARSTDRMILGSSRPLKTFLRPDFGLSQAPRRRARPKERQLKNFAADLVSNRAGGGSSDQISTYAL